jgi:homoserine/homoserine lactone efflux protein
MDISVWFALLALFLVGGLTPGPAVMMVMSTSLRYGAAMALIPAVGVSTANLVWITLAASGLATFAASAPLVLLILKIAGLLFISWLAWSMATSDPCRPRASAAQSPPKAHLFGRGLGLQMLNPNALVFFGLLLPSYFVAGRPVVIQAAIIMATVTVTEMIGLTIYAWAADAMNQYFQNPAFTVWFNRVAAAAMLAAVVFAAFLTTAK